MFRATVSESRLRSFSRAFFCCAKIGNALMLETDEDRVVFSTVNQQRSAYAKFAFSSSFFSVFRGPATAIKCKINLKTFLLAFRSLGKTRKLHFRLDGAQNEVQMELVDHNGIRRTYRFPFEDDAEVIGADFKTHGLNMVSSSAKMFQTRFVENFASALTEASVIPTSSSITMKSYITVSHSAKFFHTECQISAADFSEFRIHPDAYGQEITFPLREMKAMLGFCKELDNPFYLFFGMPGQPILMTNSDDGKTDIYVMIVVSTLGDPDAAPASELNDPSPEPARAPPRDDLSARAAASSSRGDDAKALHAHAHSPRAGRAIGRGELRRPDSRNTARSDEPTQRAAAASASSTLSPTQVSSWGKKKQWGDATRPRTQNTDERLEVDSKISFDLHPPGGPAEKRRRTEIDDASLDPFASSWEDQRGRSSAIPMRVDRSGDESDSDGGSFVAGTPESATQ